MGQPTTIPFPTGDTQASRNGRGAGSQASPDSRTDDADARYAAALKLVEAIDYNLRNGTEHYYDTQGRLLRSLDEVINAALTDTLAPGKPVEQPKRDEAVEWVSASELVA